MDSASLALIGFGLMAALVMSISSSVRWRAGVLLVLNLSFLYMVGARLDNMAPMACFLVFGFLGTRVIDRARLLVPLFVVATVLLFAYLKKYTFFPEGALLSRPYFTLGLSYIFFRITHLLIETREMAPQARPGVLDYLGYTLNFTTLVSGPIQRYPDFKESMSGRGSELDFATVMAQVARIALGYFKVNVVASILDILRVNALLALDHGAGAETRFAAVVVLVVVYPFFLYANFSGYIDIVIALARLMKIRLPENFDRPFTASSFLEFWNRWHITLSQWLKFYVYNPLLIFLMRRVASVPLQPYLGVLCFFVTFFLIGVWHGRTSEFAVFGLLQGGGVAMNKLWQIFMGKRLGKKRYKALCANAVYVALGRGLTFSWFAFTMFWFWGDWSQIGAIFEAITPLAWALVWLLVIAASGICLTAVETLHLRVTGPEGLVRSPIMRGAFASILLGAIVFSSFFYCGLLDQPAPGIVYKAF